MALERNHSARHSPGNAAGNNGMLRFMEGVWEGGWGNSMDVVVAGRGGAKARIG